LFRPIEARRYHSLMDQQSRANKRELVTIARRAMMERGLLPDFSPAVAAELHTLSAPIVHTDPDARDLRHLPWASIDDDNSLDLDQLTVAVPMSGGDVKILVAVADVDAIVKAGSAIDGHARVNTTSVYTAAAIFPMLPPHLSTDLTSLGEAADRVVVVTELLVRKGLVMGADI
jgi:exoribonuclease R